MNSIPVKRRRFLQWLSGLAGAWFVPAGSLFAAGPTRITRPIPKTGEPVPVIGMGTWLTFNVEKGDTAERNKRVAILKSFFDRGGAVVDSSPMYGWSEDVLGYCLKRRDYPDSLFAATKVWTYGEQVGIAQMEGSQRLWGVEKFDLMQIHNMVDWETHLETLIRWKAEGRIRYIGITTSHGRRHRALEDALRRHDSFDFVQFSYNIMDREAEQRLLPLAAERKLAVIVNRPFQTGGLFPHVQGKALPSWAEDFHCANWAQFFLKFIVSHPAVTCAIPATAQKAHMEQNMGANFGPLPDAKTRQRMIRYFEDV